MPEKKTHVNIIVSFFETWTNGVKRMRCRLKQKNQREDVSFHSSNICIFRVHWMPFDCIALCIFLQFCTKGHITSFVFDSLSYKRMNFRFFFFLLLHFNGRSMFAYPFGQSNDIKHLHIFFHFILLFVSFLVMMMAGNCLWTVYVWMCR